MTEAPDPRLFPYADHVLDRLDADREYGPAVREAAEGGEPLLLDFHAHADGSGWCAAVRVHADEDPDGQRDLVHLRGLVKTRDECAPMARVLAGLMTRRYRMATPPRIVLDRAELYL